VEAGGGDRRESTICISSSERLLLFGFCGPGIARWCCRKRDEGVVSRKNGKERERDERNLARRKNAPYLLEELAKTQMAHQGEG
jgi:hypothetical protein